jgi:hypothetical protein
MAEDAKIDLSRYTGAGQNDEAARQRPREQSEVERNPDYQQRKSEREGRSEWSGGNMGGGVWAGRSR